MITSLGKAQLALQYFPDSAPDVARARLMRAINRCRPLLAAMANTGYYTTSRDFTPRQVALINEYLVGP